MVPLVQWLASGSEELPTSEHLGHPVPSSPICPHQDNAFNAFPTECSSTPCTVAGSCDRYADGCRGLIVHVHTNAGSGLIATVISPPPPPRILVTTLSAIGKFRGYPSSTKGRRMQQPILCILSCTVGIFAPPTFPLLHSAAAA